MTATLKNNLPPFGDMQIKHATIAVCLSFVLFGLILGMWFVHIPTVVARLNIDTAKLGFILLATPIGGAVAQPILGRIAARTGPLPLLFFAYIWAPIAVILPIMAWNEWVLTFGLFMLGMATATLNIGKAIQGSQVELLRGKASMPLFHGFFSVGILLATLLGSLIFSFKLDDGTGAIIISLFMIIIGLWSYAWFLPIKPQQNVKKPTKTKKFKLPNIRSYCDSLLLIYASI